MSNKMAHFRSNLRKAWFKDSRTAFRSISAWGIFGAIIVVFIFWGVAPRHQGVTSGGVAAAVDGDSITVAELHERVEMMSKSPQFQQLEGLGDFAQKFLQQQALGGLIDEKLLNKRAERDHLFSSDAAVRDAIMEISAFAENGKFSHSRYLNYLQATRQEAGEFEARVRKELIAQNLMRSFSVAMAPLSAETRLLGDVDRYKAEVDGLTVSTEKLVEPNEVSAADVKVFLEKGDGKGDPKARVKTYYETHVDEFKSPPKAKVRHILVKADKKDSKAVAAAQEKAKGLLQKLKAGADFAKLAQENSDDPGSKSTGGVIDFFPKGAMVPEFENYAFSGPIGKISDLVQTDYGFHIIKVEDRKAEENKSLADSETFIAQKLIAKEKSKTESENFEKLVQAGDVKAIDTFASAHKLKWVSSGPFAMTATSIPKVGGGEDAVSAAFKLTAKDPVTKSPLRQGPEAIVLRLKSPPTLVAADPKEKKDAPEAMALALRRGDEAFGTWLSTMRKVAKISVNSETGKNTAAADE